VIYKETAFWAGNLLAALLLLILAAWLQRRRKLEHDSSLARRHFGNKQVRKALQQAQGAAKAGDAGKFLEAARSALQERISHLSDRPIDAKTLVTSDCRKLLEDKNMPDPAKSRIDEILNAADACHFAGVRPSPSQLQSMAQNLVTAIADLNRIIR
jgi:hypothetical protein